MPFFLDFFNRNGKAFLFLTLLLVSLFLMFSFQNYHHTKLYRQMFSAQSQVNEQFSNFGDYFQLNSLNQELVQENQRLKQENLNLSRSFNSQNKKIYDSLKNQQTYELISAEVVNSVNRAKNNYYTLNIGKKDGLQEGLAVITSKGVVGHIAMLDNDFALVISALHPETRIKSKLRNTEYFGTLKWNGADPRVMQLQNIDKYINVNLNDTIETYKSTIYPEGVPIGTIIDKKVDTRTGKWDLAVQLFQDLNSVDYVYVVQNLQKVKIDSLENRSKILDAE